MDTLLIFEDEKGALAPKACELLARDRRLVPIPAGAPDTALSVAIDASDAGVAILARGTTAAAALAFAAHADDRISALVLESPPDAGSNAVLASLLPQTALPTLVIYGTEDRSTPADCGRRYKALLPNSWFIMVYRAGPDIAGDRPEGFADLVGDFLKRGARFTLSERSARLNP